MPKEVPSTDLHRGPERPDQGRRRPALICAFPRPLAVPLPTSGTILGRPWLADLGLHDGEVSGSHVRIDRAGGSLRIADAGSRNGTWVDGTRLVPDEPATLRDGSVVRLGRTLFVARDHLPGPLEPAPPVGEQIGPYGLRQVAQSLAGLSRSRPRNVLVEGETGVGKELTARAVANALGRAAPFAAVNAAGVPAGVFESQLFGHVAGAFSGAGTAAAGLVRAHDGGALLLDEIGELSLPLQAKLLRLLDNREILPVGAERPVTVDLLVIAASNRDLEQMVEDGTFRRDLFTRLAMARIEVPPLRARREDIFFVAGELAGRAGAPLAPDRAEVEAVERLLLEPWPGNVRQLDAALGAARRLDPDGGLRLWALEEALGAETPPGGALTRATVEAAIEAAGGNATAAARQLGISRGKLLRLRKG